MGVIKLRITRLGGYPSLSRWALNAITSIIKREAERDYIHRRGKGHVTTEVEIRMMKPQAKEC